MEEAIIQKWNTFLGIVRDNVNEEQYNTWFKIAELVKYSDNKLTVCLPSAFFIDRWENEYYNLVSISLRKIFGGSVRLNYEVSIIGNDENSKIVTPSNRQSPAFTNKLDAVSGRFGNNREAAFDSQLSPTLTFENYCVGESNKLPFTIAEYISNNPDKSDFNPFVLYGPVGVGKTHLIQAIGIRIKERNPKAKVLYTTIRQFQNLYANAAIKKVIPNFINWYQQMDVIIFDDLQELSHKSGTMEAIFPIFNHLHQNKKNLIFACDRPPRELDGISDRLIDRFKWGVTEELKRPDYALKKKILTFKAQKNGLALSGEIIDLIAEQSTGSVRELEGIVMGILYRSISTDGTITLDIAREVMRHTLKPIEKKTINFDMIVETTAEHFNINPDAIFSKNRMNDIAEARQVIMYLSHKHTNLSSSAIGSKLNRRHATVLYGISTIEKRLSVSKELTALLGQIEEDLKR